MAPLSSKSWVPGHGAARRDIARPIVVERIRHTQPGEVDRAAVVLGVGGGVPQPGPSLSPRNPRRLDALDALRSLDGKRAEALMVGLLIDSDV